MVKMKEIIKKQVQPVSYQFITNKDYIGCQTRFKKGIITQVDYHTYAFHTLYNDEWSSASKTFRSKKDVLGTLLGYKVRDTEGCIVSQFKAYVFDTRKELLEWLIED